jgi:calcineurin-like phosphoesterase family protein
VSNTWVISDYHFGHAGVCRFMNSDGTKLRPWDNPDEMDEELIKRTNDVVRPKDKLYVLGDVCINRKSINTIARCNGDKVLIKGNHDLFRLEEYTRNFRDIRAYHVLNNCIMSHIPIHTSQLERFNLCVHGHTHANDVLNLDGSKDLRYYNVCVEKINYTPINIEVIYDYFKRLEETK